MDEYLSFLAGLMLIFRHQIQTYFQVKTDLIIIVSGVMTSILTFLSGALLYSLTQTLIVGFHQAVTHSGTIIYLDVETGGIFKYFSPGMGIFCLGLGGNQFLSRKDALNADRLS